jgi:hypothetical protein
MIRGLACLAVFLGAAAPVLGQESGLTPKAPLSAQSEGPPPTKLTVRPAPAPERALKYQLLPEVKDRSPGNAALLYQRAHSPDWWSTHFRQQRDLAKLERWLEVPLKQLPREEMRYLETWGALREVDLAARREYCDWQMTERARSDGLFLLLPDVQSFREYARLLSMRARLEMADGKIDKSLYTLQSGFSLARDVATAPTLINTLVSLAIAQHMADRVEELVQLPNSPNLYWALTTLPEPFVDLLKPLQGDRLFLEAEMPELKTIEARPWSERDQEVALDNVVHFGLYRQGVVPQKHLDRRLAFVALVIKTYPEAKRFLLSRGRKAAEVEAMPSMQVALIYLLHTYQRIQDDQCKWAALPYWQASVGLQKAENDIRTAASHLDLMPFNEFLPAVQKVYEARVRFDRRVAALRCIEAIRLYAAAHQGKLPETLSDITEVPIPVDPVTGRGFDYAVAGDRVTLRESRLADGRPARMTQPLHYEVTFQR